MTQHQCLTCKLADWRKADNGRRHPSGDGKCQWKPPHIPTPKAWTWDLWRGQQPKPSGGSLRWKPFRPITDCETYEAAKPEGRDE